MYRSPNVNAKLVKSGRYAKVASKTYRRISDGVEISYHCNSFTWRISNQPRLTWKSLFAAVAQVEDQAGLETILDA